MEAQLTLLAVLVVAVVLSKCWGHLQASMWFVARAAQLGLVGLLPASLGGGWTGVGTVLAAAVLTSPVAWVLSGKGRTGLLKVAPDAFYWAGVSALTGLGAATAKATGMPNGGVSVIVAVVVVVGLCLELMLGRGATGRMGLRALLPAETFATLSIAATAAALVAVVPVTGWWFVPVALAPLLNISSALKGRSRARAVAQETVTALSRLPDVAGYTRPGHGARVSDLAVDIGRAMDLGDGELEVLRQGGLLHDVGLVSLNTRIKEGGTSLLAPLDEQRIAARSAEIVAEVPADPEVTEAIRSRPYPFIDHVMYRATLSRAARVLKVANAVDDYTGGERSEDALRRALTRLSMHQGYEFDPEVVVAARAVLTDPVSVDD
ncbi:HD-GYP domain-containing protein [Kytococcus sp. Marseille-QA3725]